MRKQQFNQSMGLDLVNKVVEGPCGKHNCNTVHLRIPHATGESAQRTFINCAWGQGPRLGHIKSPPLRMPWIAQMSCHCPVCQHQTTKDFVIDRCTEAKASVKDSSLTTSLPVRMFM